MRIYPISLSWFSVFALATAAYAASPSLAASRSYESAKAASPATAHEKGVSHNQNPIPSASRRAALNEVLEITRTALQTSRVKLAKGAEITRVRSSVDPTATELVVPIAPSRVTIDFTPPARKPGTVTTAGVLVFWTESRITARLPLRVDVAMAASSLGFDVPRGAPVTLLVRKGLVEVSAPAVTASDADIGDVVNVLLRPSGRSIRAEIIANDRAVAVGSGADASASSTPLATSPAPPEFATNALASASHGAAVSSTSIQEGQTTP